MDKFDDSVPENRELLVQEVERMVKAGVYTREEARQRLGLAPKPELAPKVDKVDAKPTWVLAWGLWWRAVLITLGIYAIIFGIIFAVFGAGLFALLERMPAY